MIMEDVVWDLLYQADKFYEEATELATSCISKDKERLLFCIKGMNDLLREVFTEMNK